MDLDEFQKPIYVVAKFLEIVDINIFIINFMGISLLSVGEGSSLFAHIDPFG